MTLTSLSAVAAILTLVLIGGTPSAAEPAKYRPVSSADVIQGYVAAGEWIETAGHVWVSAEGVFLAFNQPSAMPALRIDVANVSPEALGRLKTDCSTKNQFSGGCRATIRGQTQRVGDGRGIMAWDIRHEPPR